MPGLSSTSLWELSGWGVNQPIAQRWLDRRTFGWEAHPWRREPDHGASRRQQLSARGPYEAAVPVKIAESTLQVDVGLRAEAEDAVREITRFDAEVTAIAERRAAREGDDASTELAPLASVLLRTESASSSEIEGATAGARALALAAIEAKAGPNAQLVTANVTAMQRAVALADDISVVCAAASLTSPGGSR